MATYPIRQLADNGGTAQFVPVTAPEAVQFPDGSNLNALIGSIATIESNPVAANHAVGEFLCINGQVYEVIDTITAGDSIALGENVQVANLGSQITALNNGLNTVATLLTQRSISTSNTKYTLSESVSNFALIAIVCGWSSNNVLDTVFMPSAVWSSNTADAMRLWVNRQPSANIYVDVKSRTATTLYCQSNNENVFVGVYGILRVN